MNKVSNAIFLLFLFCAEKKSISPYLKSNGANIFFLETHYYLAVNNSGAISRKLRLHV
jgi:hypothetical protein